MADLSGLLRGAQDEIVVLAAVEFASKAAELRD